MVSDKCMKKNVNRAVEGILVHQVLLWVIIIIHLLWVIQVLFIPKYSIATNVIYLIKK